MEAKIILDTSFIVNCTNFKVDFISELDKIFGKYKLFIIEKTIDEIDNLINLGGKYKPSAKLAKAVIEALKPQRIISQKYVDEAIIDESLKEEFFIATNDAKLKKKLIDLRRKVIILRQKKYLVVV